MKKTSKFIIDLINGSNDVNFILSKLIKQYSIEERILRKDLIIFLRDLWLENIIVWSKDNYIIDLISKSSYKYMMRSTFISDYLNYEVEWCDHSELGINNTIESKELLKSLIDLPQCITFKKKNNIYSILPINN